MLKAITENDELVNIRATKDGIRATKDGKLLIDTDEALKIAKEIETTLNASVQTIGTTSTTIAINKKITQIDIANYSEEADITLVAGDISAVIGGNIATTLKINKQIENISLTATAENTKIQLVISGVE